MGQDALLKRVPIAVADSIVTHVADEVATYLPGQDGGPPVLYRRSGNDIALPNYRRLKDAGVQYLLVSGCDLASCERQLEDGITEVLKNGEIEADQKAAYVQHVCVSVARSLITHPDPASQIDRTSRVLDKVMVGLLEQPAVANNLLNISLHHRSTASHMFAVATLGMMLAAEVFGPDSDMVKEVGLAGFLHDVGKSAISADILNKEEQLTPEEILKIQQHPMESIRIIGDTPLVSKTARQMILQHHERVDGKGYPLGLPGNEIAVGSKVLTIVDSFHALIGKRSYRSSLTPKDAMRVLKCAVGRQIEEAVFECWERVFERAWQPNIPILDLEEDAAASAYHNDHKKPRSNVARRRIERHACEGRIRVNCVHVQRLCTMDADPEESFCDVYDVSRAGLCMGISHPMYHGDVVHILLDVDGGAVWVRGVIRWCRRSGEVEGYRVGVKFADRLEERQER